MRGFSIVFDQVVGHVDQLIAQQNLWHSDPTQISFLTYKHCNNIFMYQNYIAFRLHVQMDWESVVPSELGCIGCQSKRFRDFSTNCCIMV